MKTGLFLLLLITGVAFGQSKKELKAQVASYQQKLDSANLALEKTQRINDSLSGEIQQKENELKTKQAVIDKASKKLESLKAQIERLKSSKEKDSLSKLHEIPRDRHIDFRRFLIKSPDVSAISSKKSCTILFRVIIDEKGDVIETPKVIKSSTTTTDQVLIKKVAALVKSQAKYNSDKGAANRPISIVIRIHPN